MPSIVELLSEPYGPWPDSLVLAHTLKSTKTRRLELKRVHLSSNGIPIGLTNCETAMPEYKDSKSDIRIRGVLEIQSLSWLSSEGYDLLQGAIRERDGPNSGFTLATLYGNSSRARSSRVNAKIWIDSVKLMSAVYLLSDVVPNGLYIKTRDQSRWYEITSLHPATFTKSLLYLSRYRALRVLRDIVRYDADQSNEPTLRSLRTPKWFSAMYLRLMDHQSQRRSPAVHLSSDSESDHMSRNSRRVRPRLEGPLRSTSRSEVETLLLRHRKWLIADQELRRHHSDRYFDTEVWGAWTQPSRDTESPPPDQGRVEADVDDDDDLYAELDPPQVKNEQDLMDVDVNVDSGNEEDIDELADYSSSSSPPPTPSMSERRRGKRKAEPEPIRPPAPPVPQGREVRGQSRFSPRASPAPTDEENKETDGLYDWDFSPPSTPDWSGDSDDSTPDRAQTPPSPTLLAAIPSCFFHPPKLPSYSFRWYCPIDDCTYMIDLLSLTPENRRGIPKEDIRRLETGGWNLSDAWVLRCFGLMVSKHWREHLDQQGIFVSRVDGKTRVEWKHPVSHPSTHSQARQRRMKELSEEVKLKEEEN